MRRRRTAPSPYRAVNLRAKPSNVILPRASTVVRPAIAALLAAGAFASARAAILPPGTQLAAKQELVRNNGDEPETLDPALNESIISGAILLDLFEGLTASDRHGDVVPGVAESWKQVDATTWVFKLRRNAAWSNGKPVTAEDFVYSWRRFLDPKTAAKNAFTYGAYLLNGAEIVSGKKPPSELGVRAIDAQTLEIRTAGPVPFLPAALTVAQYLPQPRAAVEKFGKDWTKPANMVSNGAYVLKDWQVNGRIVVEKNPAYWDAANVQLTRVTYLCVEDTNADLKLYQSGEEDIMLRLPAGVYGALKAQYPAEMRNGPVLALRYYELNNLDPLLKDVRVRKALSLVIDRDILASKVTVDGQPPVYGLAVKGMAGFMPTRYDWADWPMDRRVAEARSLLAAAGVKPGTRLKLTYVASDYHKRMAIFVASEWKAKLGLETEIASLEGKVLMQTRHEGNFQVADSGWVADFNDATQFLPLVQCGSDANVDRSCNRKVDDLVVQGNLSMDPARREVLLTQAARLAMDDYPMIPTLQYTLPRLVKPWVGGYEANGLGHQRSKDLYIMKH